VKNKLKSAEKTVATLGEEIDAMQVKIQEDRTKWEPQLLSMITKINIKFSAHMEEMNFVGNATLIKGDDPDDPSQYALGLTVQFRNVDDPHGRASARLLNEKTHSGGEKAVTTILFLISLQHMTHCPFRVVDEINQGMDAVNEGRVFSILGRETNSGGDGGDDAPQYFLITPKLLEGLEYSGDVSVLVVMNGPYVFCTTWSPTLCSFHPHRVLFYLVLQAYVFSSTATRLSRYGVEYCRCSCS
jgi:chromosome segregation ATPase